VAPTFLSLMTYSKDGAVLEESNTTAIRSLAPGEWEHLGDRRFTRTMLLFRFNAARDYLGLGRITAQMRLKSRGDMFRAEAKIENFDPDGNLVNTLYSLEEGQAMRIRSHHGELLRSRASEARRRPAVVAASRRRTLSLRSAHPPSRAFNCWSRGELLRSSRHRGSAMGEIADLMACTP
jgi:hypothetical protein